VIDSRRIAPPLLAISVLVAIARGMLLLLLPIDGLAAGGLLGGFALPGMLSVGSSSMPVLGALLVERLGHKRVWVAALTLAGVGALVIALSETTLGRALGALLYGSGSGLGLIARLTYLSDALSIATRGRIVSAVGGMGRIGMFIGPALAGLLATRVSRDAGLFVAAALAFAAAATVLLLPGCATLPSKEARGHVLSFLPRVLRSHWPTFSRVGLVMFALAFIRSARMLLIPICGTMLGLDEGAVGFAKSASMGIDMLLFYPAGLIMDRKGRKWTAIPCLVILSLGVLVVGLAETTLVFVVGAMVAGFGNGLGAGINMTMAGDFSPREGRAEFIGVWTLMTEIGSVTSPFASGLIAQTLTLGPASAVVACIGLGASAFMALAVAEPLRSRAGIRDGRADASP